MGLAQVVFLWMISSAIALFAVISIGVTSQSESGQVIDGTEPAAPVDPRMARKALYALAAGGCFTLVFWAGMASGYFSWLVGLITPETFK